MSALHPLDDPVGHALRGLDAAYAVWSGTAVRFHPDVGPFAALAPDPGPQDWADLARLLGPEGGGAVVGPPPLPPGWRTVASYDVVQMAGPERAGDPSDSPDPPDDGVEPLDPVADRDEAQDLVRRTEPGPFGPRTMELGGFVGIRQRGRLVAMAGERMHPPGWAEVSAVCTDPAVRGQGLASRLVRAVATGVHARGERPYLHVMAANAGAIRVYSALGFTVRRARPIVVVRPPA